MSRITLTPLPCVRFLEDGDKILLPVVDRALGAEVAADGAFLWAAGGREDTRAKGARELDRRRADAARPAVHEKALSGGEPAAIEDVGPHREEGFGQTGGIDERNALRHRQALRRRRDAIFGIAAAGNQRADRIALMPSGHLRAERGDGSGDFEAED